MRNQDSIQSAPGNAAQRIRAEAQAGDALFGRGQVAEARLRFIEAIRLAPDNPSLYFRLAMCDWNLGSMDSAGAHLQTAVRLDGRMGAAQASLGQWFLIRGMVDLALDASAKALESQPENTEFIEMRAWVLEASGDVDGAWGLIKGLIARGQSSISVARLYGRMARHRGEQEQALAMALSQRTPSGDALVGDLDYIAADLLDSLGRYDEAFAHAARGNRMRASGFNAALFQQTIDGMIKYFTRRQIESLPTATYRSDRPIFIVGMPRSGTSLLEQILASHPAVYGAGELDFMFRVVHGTLGMLKAREDDYPACLDSMSIDMANGLAQIYLEPLNALSRSASRIVDKMPYNFMHLGLMASLLPDAKIIHCVRDPLDTCLSCYMAPFMMGNTHTQDLTHLGLFYRQYERLMAHWTQVLPLPMLEVRYEDVIAEPEKQSRRMVEFIGLPWDERCLAFHQTKRAVATASVHQVRKPIYGSSVQRWRKYEKHLGPLKAALGMQ